MSVKIESIEQLTKLVEKLGLQIRNPDELKELLEVANRPQPPETVRQESLKMIGFLVPAITVGAAMIVSIVLITQIKKAPIPFDVVIGGLSAIWGGAAAICLPAIGYALYLLGRPRPAEADSTRPPGPRQAELADRLAEAFTTGNDS